MKIVYRHRRLDTNEVFYIGMGNVSRAYDKRSRNSHWSNIVNKSGYEVDIIAENLSIEDALELEVFLIEEYGRYDLGTGPLVNKTDGGEGTKNCKPWNKGIPRTEEVKLSISLANKGHKERTSHILAKYLYSLDGGNSFYPVHIAAKLLGYKDTSTLSRFARGKKSNNKLQKMIIDNKLIIKKK